MYPGEEKRGVGGGNNIHYGKLRLEYSMFQVMENRTRPSKKMAGE